MKELAVKGLRKSSEMVQGHDFEERTCGKSSRRARWNNNEAERVCIYIGGLAEHNMGIRTTV